jgi:lipopolysaccharide biosynthesis glycosyltransferase
MRAGIRLARAPVFGQEYGVAIVRDPIVVVTASDEAYAMPLAVMGRSLIANLESGRRVHLYVIARRLGERSRRRILDSWDADRLDVTWLDPDLRRLREVKVSGHVRVATYFRLLIGSLLPDTVERAIYLDADVIVEQDLGPLWELDLDGHPIAAAQDWIVLTVSAPNGLATWRELGLDVDQKYFNAGVLLIDLARWRRERTEQRILDHLKTHRELVRWWDQDGLNAVLGRECLELDPRWNLNIRNRIFPSPESLPFSSAEYEAIVAAPRICHFATHVKPWHSDCAHPRRDRFFHYLDQTTWAGWRPNRPAPQPSAGLRHSIVRLAARLRSARTRS